MESNKKIILFDGICNLCNSSVQFAIKRDENDIFRYAALQSETGRRLLEERSIDTKKVDSIILIEPNIAYYTKSTAALEIGKNLRGLRTISSILLWLPESFRNIVYDFIAANRYKWYGKKEACMIPTEDLKRKFI
ncbi:DCC1-like thiol-disulfide oxidoreductase family protein [Maribacter sp. M208]|uniref:thiol-disulfide oxidoreductase DCC family protein n=1 Tax=Maribacter TaxID=252356 RepID=UPI0023EE2331|nr:MULTISPECIES: DCC1-like thiol-disulfide oxidoreductase family protein [Maribacter]MDF4222151.1 DCC1-like thiol-disulfide oxidoreductase family protein [Maribacter huludaoensis]